MNIQAQIQAYIESLPTSKQADIQALHQRLIQIFPNCKIWFFDGKNETGKVVSNPAIGYGTLEMKYANGKTKEWFRIGISTNQSGISVYLLGIEDKKYLDQTYGQKLGKASTSGYCIKFKKLQEINIEVLEEAIKDAYSRI